MMKKLRGRNLAHPGCLIGITVGMTLGIILAGVLAAMNVALNTDLLTWFGLTLGLGALGWIIGERLTSRCAAVDEQVPAGDETTSPVSEPATGEE